MRSQKIFILLFLLMGFNALVAQVVDLTNAKIMASSTLRNPVRHTIIRVLQEEVAKRTGINLSLISLREDNNSLIILASVKDKNINGIPVPLRPGNNLPEQRTEGYRLVINQINGKNILWLIGADERGVLFSIGEFLRNAYLEDGKISFDKKNEIASSPEYPIRGHQLGYRNTANSWDAWDTTQFETYIRELAIFGANAIECIPFQDGEIGPLMHTPRPIMNKKISEICQNYGLDFWAWTPCTSDLSDPKQVQIEFKKHSDFYKSVPKLDDVFFPGGDPGHNSPKDILPFLEKIAVELHKYHPNAGIWISLQNFKDDEIDYFYDFIKRNSPDWLIGVVSGPNSPEVASTRFELPKKYKHRWYPDITHTLRTGFPLKKWDQAFILTEGREISNPMPFYYTDLFKKFIPFTDGFISYSDGVHDDVNKMLYNELAWNSQKSVLKILEEYCRFFFGNVLARKGAVGILSLEKNWDGPVERNVMLELSFSFWKELNSTHPELKNNWRWQLLNLRSYYDTYQARRKIYEKALEEKANGVMAQAKDIGVDVCMRSALEIVKEADEKPIYPEMRQCIVDYCEKLWKSIGLQTSVEKYHAKNFERGAILDFIDYPLNNRWWLEDEFKKIGQMKNDQEKIDELRVIANWEYPGDGNYYDNISDLSQSPHLGISPNDNSNVAFLDEGFSRMRLSTQLFQNFPLLHYNNLDPNSDYVVRILGVGEALLRANGHQIESCQLNERIQGFKQFKINRRLIINGQLTLTFDIPSNEINKNWKVQSRISDVWLIKQNR